MIIARYDVILDQSERALLYNQLSNYTKSNDYYKLLLLLLYQIGWRVSLDTLLPIMYVCMYVCTMRCVSSNINWWVTVNQSEN